MDGNVNVSIQGAEVKKSAPTPLERAHATHEDALLLIDRLEALADRLVGPVPQSDGDSAGVANCGGELGSLANNCVALTGRISDAHSALNRIEEMLP